MNPGTVNVLSFDVEHWYSATLLRDVSNPETHIHESVNLVLDALEKYDVRATFFVVGELAREHPTLVARIAAAGHEIGSHGHTHRPLFELDRDEFAVELDRSTDAIRGAIGTTPVGFRAPNFSVTQRTEWAIEILEAAGYRYDSSVFPVKTPMYGVKGAPLGPYCPDPSAPFEARSTGTGQLIELPLAVLHSWFRVPVAGGFYARLLPIWLLKRGIRTLNAHGLPATLYFHPWEFNPAVTTKDVPAHKRFVSFHGIHGTKAKLEALLDSFEFTAADAVVRKYANRLDVTRHGTTAISKTEDAG
jgi:polysaccharide deacetylase family protein (PEP-CTERM system associated)